MIYAIIILTILLIISIAVNVYFIREWYAFGLALLQIEEYLDRLIENTK